MTENGREQALRIGAGKGEIVGVADAGRLDLDQHLAGLRAVELDGHDFERLARFDSDCGANVHAIRLPLLRLASHPTRDRQSGGRGDAGEVSVAVRQAI